MKHQFPRHFPYRAEKNGRRKKLTYLVLLKLRSRFPRQNGLQRLQEWWHLSLGQRVEAIKDVVDVLSNVPPRAAVACRIPYQGAFQHCDAAVEVNCEHGHVRDGNDAEKLLPHLLGLQLGFHALVDIGTCPYQCVSIMPYLLARNPPYQTTSRSRPFPCFEEARPFRETTSSPRPCFDTGTRSCMARPS